MNSRFLAALVVICLGSHGNGLPQSEHVVNGKQADIKNKQVKSTWVYDYYYWETETEETAEDVNDVDDFLDYEMHTIKVVEDSIEDVDPTDYARYTTYNAHHSTEEVDIGDGGYWECRKCPEYRRSCRKYDIDSDDCTWYSGCMMCREYVRRCIWCKNMPSDY